MPSSANCDDAVILAMHVPLAEDAFSTAVKSAIAKVDRPVLSLVGHRHTDAVEDAAAGDRNFVQVRTAIFSRAGNGGRIIRLLEERMEVCATGDAARIVRTISVPRPAAAKSRQAASLRINPARQFCCQPIH